MSAKTTSTFRYNGRKICMNKEKGKWKCRLYLGYVIENGEKKQRRKEFTATSEKELKARIKAYMDANGTGMEHMVHVKSTFEDLAKEWFAREKLSARHPKKNTTLSRIKMTLYNQVIPTFGRYDTQKLTYAFIQDQLDAMIRGTGGQEALSYSSVKKVKSTMNQIFEYAIKNGYQRENPMLYVEVLQLEQNNPWVDLQSITEENILTKEEQRCFLEAATKTYSNGAPIYPLGWGFIFILHTGLRTGEALALTWADIDLDKKCVYVRKNLTVAKDPKDFDGTAKAVISITTPKTKTSRRKVILNQYAIHALQELKEITRPKSEQAPVFANQFGEYTRPDHFRRSFYSIKKRANIQHGACVHMLRHTYATNLFDAGVDIEYISRELGHNTTDITRHTYIHFLKEEDNPHVRQLQNIHFDGIPNF